MNAMIERVRRAIEDAYDNCPHEVDQLWDYCARAAIAAMRDILESDGHRPGERNFDAIALIDAALKDEP